MKCLKCSGTDFEIKKIRFAPKIKNHLVEVVAPCNVCTRCDTPLMNTSQLNNLRRISADAYREMKGLLTSRQIVSYRENLKMSQSAFADFLNVGEASVKRWESHHIQDSSQDDHMRIKCDEAKARENYVFLLTVNEKPNIYNGHRASSKELFNTVRHYIKKKEPQGHFNKIHFYIDFLHFKKYAQSITGFKYLPLKYGPCPSISNLFPLPDPGSDLIRGSFDDHEQVTIDSVCSIYSKMGERRFSEMTRSEKGYLETDESNYISYEYAKELLI